MRHKDQGFAEPGHKGAKLPLQLEARHWIERAKGLIEQEERWIVGEGARHTDALSLTTGELMRVSRTERHRIESDEREQLTNALLGAGARPALQTGHQADVLRHREMREQTDLLDHVADAPAESRVILRRQVVARDPDVPGARCDESIDEPERGRFSSAAATEQDERLAGAHGKRHIIDERSALQLVPQAAHVEDHIHDCDATWSASNSGSVPWGPSYRPPLIKKVGVPLTPLFKPLITSSLTRAR